MCPGHIRNQDDPLVAPGMEVTTPNLFPHPNSPGTITAGMTVVRDSLC